MTAWYKRIKSPRSKAARIRGLKPANTRRTSIRIRSPQHIYEDRYSRAIYINGIELKVCTRNSIALYFGVRNTTILRWDDRGVLPQPFYHVNGQRGMLPVYLVSQVLALRKVVKDLVEDGYVSIPWVDLPEHIEMLHAGYEEAADRAYSKFENDTGVDKADRFGVVLY